MTNPFDWNPHNCQRQVFDEASQDGRFFVLCCGRRWGKTESAMHLLEPALYKQWYVAYCAPTNKMLAEFWRETKHHLIDVTVGKSEQLHRLDLVGGGLIEMWSLENYDTIRGRRYHRVIIDEAAMVKGLHDAWVKVIRPTLSDYKGDAWFLSTPRGYNYFRELWMRGQERDRPDNKPWRSWRFPSETNPHLDPDEVAAMRRDLPSRVAAQEVDAEFVTDGSVFRRVMENATAKPLDGPIEGYTYVAGVDWGRTDDYTVIVVMDARSRTVVYLDRFSDLSWDIQYGRLQTVCDRFRPYDIVAEENAIGGPGVERLQRMGLPVQGFTMTPQSKTDLVLRMALALERNEVTLLDDPVLIGELLAYEESRLPGGRWKYSAPEGGHDDTVVATMLALSACYDSGGVLL